MKNALSKDLKREIRRTWSRFVSILVIIALGVGFFVGVKATSPSMKKTADQYFNESQLMDFKLLSTFGFDKSDVNAIKEIQGVDKVMPSYSVDAILKEDHKSYVVRMYALPEKDSEYNDLNKPVLLKGRMPKEANECVAEIPINSSIEYEIGQKITVSRDIDDSTISDVLKQDTYTIVGIVESSMYITYDRGISSIGDGSIANYFMIPAENFLYPRYTELYVTTTSHNDLVSAFNDKYQNQIDRMTTAFNDMSLDRYAIFKEDVTTEASTQISDAEKQLSAQKESAQTQLEDAKNKLEEAKTQLENSKAELEKGQADYEAGVKEASEQLAAAEKQINESRQTIFEAANKITSAKQEYQDGVKEYNTKTADGAKQLQAGWNQYNENVVELNNNIEALNEGRKQLDQGKIDYQAGVKEYNDGVEELNSKKQQLEDGKDSLQTAILTRDFLESSISLQERNGASEESLADEKAQLADLNRQIADGQQQIADGEQKIAEAENQLVAAKETLGASKQKIDETEQQLSQAEQQINDGKAELEDAKNLLDEKQAQYDQEAAAGKVQLDQAYAEITNGEADLKDGRQKLADAEAQLAAGKADANKQQTEGKAKLDAGYQEVSNATTQIEDGQQKYDASVIDAELQIKDGEDRIQNAKNQVNAIEPGKWYVFTREDNPGYSGFQDDANRIDAIASIFPVFFLLVAALVCLTTMTRMVEEQRVQIGTMKALGYGPKMIAGKYFLYASSASLAGSLIGIILGVLILPKVIFGAYKAMYVLPPLQNDVPLSAVIAAIIAALICTSTVALVSCYKELRIQPATLMRPKAPKPGKRIFMEKIGFLWNHMQFTSKVTARNLFRYKGRFFMTVLGVAGCTALIVAGLGLKDAISVIVPKQFDEICDYDSIITLKQSDIIENQKDLISMLDHDDRVKDYLLTKQASAEAFDNTDTKIDIYLLVPESTEKLKNYVKLRQRGSSHGESLTDDGVIITEKLATMLNLKVGDKIKFKYEDKDYTAPVTAIVENYVYHYIYCSPAYFTKLTGSEMQYNSVLTKLAKLSAKEQSSLSSDWLENDKVIAVNFIRDIVSDFNDTIKSLNAVVLVMILSAGALAFVVLYNLTNINIAERVREIATIKVLGFYNNEVSNYVYRENIVLSVIGIVVGLIIGFFLTKFMVSTIEMDIVMFGRKIKAVSFISAAALTILFSIFVNWMMSFRMKNISMVESLKSIE